MWIVRVALERPYTFIVLALLILIVSPVMIARTPTDIFPTIVALVAERGRLRGDDLQVRVEAAAVARGEDVEGSARRDHRVLLLRRLALEDAEGGEVVLHLLERGERGLAILRDGAVVARERRLRVRAASAAVDIRRRMTATVLLIKALGGGWRVVELPTISRAPGN